MAAVARAIGVLLEEQRSPERVEDQPMQTVHELQIEPLTEEAFAPFGQIISTKERAPDFRTESGTEGWAVDFRSGRPLVMVLRTGIRGFGSRSSSGISS